MCKWQVCVCEKERRGSHTHFLLLCLMHQITVKDKISLFHEALLFLCWPFINYKVRRIGFNLHSGQCFLNYSQKTIWLHNYLECLFKCYFLCPIPSLLYQNHAEGLAICFFNNSSRKLNILKSENYWLWA